MSQHHRKQRWTTFVTWRRPEIARTLPQPCIKCGKPVLPDPPGLTRSLWHVGHIRGAANGGQPTRANTGPEHARCNLEDGGREGAAVVNARRRRAQGMRSW